MPLAMCCSPKAAVSISEVIARVVEKARAGALMDREKAGMSLFRDEEEVLYNMAKVIAE
jgi:hypothetical protein